MVRAWFQELCGKWAASKPVRKPVRKQRSVRLEVEGLENRTVPALIPMIRSHIDYAFNYNPPTSHVSAPSAPAPAPTPTRPAPVTPATPTQADYRVFLAKINTEIEYGPVREWEIQNNSAKPISLTITFTANIPSVSETHTYTVPAHQTLNTGYELFNVTTYGYKVDSVKFT